MPARSGPSAASGIRRMSGERACERINVTGHRLDAAERGRPASCERINVTGIGSTPRSGRPVTGPLPAPPRRPRTTLAVRVTLLVVAVAVLVAVIASVVGVLVVRRTLIDVTTQALSDRADVIAAQLTADPAAAGGSLAATSTVLAEQGIDVVTIGSDGSLTGPDSCGPGRASGRSGSGGRRPVGLRLGHFGCAATRRGPLHVVRWFRAGGTGRRGSRDAAGLGAAAGLGHSRRVGGRGAGRLSGGQGGLCPAAPHRRPGPCDGSGGPRRARPDRRAAGGSGRLDGRQ